MYVYMYVYTWVYTRMYLYAYMGVKHVFMFICMCWLRATAFWICLVRSEPSYRRPGPDPDSCPLWIRYIGDSKTDPWDNPEISTGSCSEDQTAIRI